MAEHAETAKEQGRETKGHSSRRPPAYVKLGAPRREATSTVTSGLLVAHYRLKLVEI